MSITSPPANRWISRSSSASISFGRTIARQHDLAAGGEHRVGEAEQLGLHLPPMGQELHVVHQQHADFGVAPAVGLSLPRRDGRVKGLDELVEGEILDARSAD